MKKLFTSNFAILFILFFSTPAFSQCNFSTYCPSGMPQWTQNLSDGCIAISENDLNCITGTMPTAPAPIQPSSWCTTIENNIYFPFEAQSTDVTIEVGAFNCQGGQGALQAAILDCDLNFVSDCWGNIPDGTSQPIHNTIPLVPGEIYLLMLDGSAGSLCDFIINGAVPSDPLGLNLCAGENSGQNVATYVSNISATWEIRPPSAGVITSSNPTKLVTIEWLEPGLHEVCTSVCANGAVSCIEINVNSAPETFLTYDVCESECIIFDNVEYCSPGGYQINYTQPSGCDSIVYLTLNELAESAIHDTLSMPCDGEFLFSGNVLTDLNSTYEFHFTNSVDCDSLHTITLLPNSVFGEAGPSKNLSCTPSATIQLEGIVHYPTSNYTIEWATANGNILTDLNTLNPTVDMTGTYCMTLTDQGSGCKMTDCVNVVHGNETLDFTFDNYQIPCDPLDTFEISLSVSPDPNDLLSWSSLDGMIVGETNLPSVSINDEGTYCLTITKPNGCDSTACIEIYNQLEVVIIAPDSHCPTNDEIMIGFDLSGDNATDAHISYQIGDDPTVWSAGLYQGMPLENSISLYEDTTIKAWAEDENGCMSDTAYFTILAIPEPVIFEVKQNFCDQASIFVFAPDSGFYEWSTGESGFNENEIYVSQNGNYSVTIYDETNGCYTEGEIYVELDFTGSCAYIKGSVKQDFFNNCAPDQGENPFENWMVEAIGPSGSLYGTTDADGNYRIPVFPDNYVVSVIPTSAVWEVCQNNINTSLSTANEEITVDFLIERSEECPLLRVDISSSIIRRCQINTYSINFCNDGTVTATDAFIDVTIDSFLIFHSSNAPFTDLGNNIIRFSIGDVAPNECDQFTFRTRASCSSPLGYTHCTQAHIFPDDFCDPPNPLWSGANLEVLSTCADSTSFIIKNSGFGGMSEPLTYTIFRNTQIHLYRQVDPLAMGESHLISLPADTATWHVEVNQDAYFPFAPLAIGSVQGCTPSGVADSIYSFVNEFPLADQNNFIDVDCRQNVGSYDPNDKQASPIGYADAHFIPDGTAIEYQIRFQNTGTDTAFSVVLKDTISNLLDISTLKMGASSHPYTYELIGSGILKIEFPNIKLPHKAIDELGSIGFIEFKITAKEGLVPLTVIQNTAAIYFDRNEPIITNTTFHTIEKPVIHGYQKVDLCEGEEWNGVPYSDDIVLNESFSFLEYDSMSWTDIQIIPPFDSTFTQFICGNNPFEFYGEVYETTGTYYQTVSPAIGCDTNFTIIIEELPAIYSSYSDQFCIEGTYSWDGIFFDQPGEYYIPYLDQNGCDSFVILTLTHADSIIKHIQIEICQGSGYLFDGQILETSGEYIATSQDEEGCEVNVKLDLQVELLYESTTTDQFCEGTTYDFHGETLEHPGFYEKTLTAMDGCDSLVHLELLENKVFETSSDAFLCSGEVYDFHGTVLDSAGQYEVTLTSSTGCDSIVKLDLSVLPIMETPIEVQICEGSTYDFYGETLDSAGQYETTLTASTGCDSLIKLDLSVVNSFDISLPKEICAGEFYLFNGDTLFTEGNYPAEFVSINGCDSLVTLSLTVWPKHENERTATICFADTAVFNGQPFYEEGIYTDSLVSVHGCDSIETFQLIIRDSIGSESNGQICEGESLDFNGQILSEEGVYTTVLSTAEGCDSTVTLFLEVEPIYTDTVTEIVLYGEIFQGVEILGDTVLTQNLIAQNGCDSLVTWLVTAFTSTTENLADQINLSIFPNPTDQHFTIEFTLSDYQPIEIKIMDVIGRNTVFEKEIITQQSDKHSIKIKADNWSAGVYLIHCQMENGVAVGKIVIE